MVSEPDRHPIDDATKIVYGLFDLIGPPAPADPTETWRATFAASGQSTSAKLRETQAALAASQADLTAMQAKHDALAVLNTELKAEAAHWRKTAEQWLTRLGEVGRDLATANRQNRLLTAENASALRRLNEKEGQS